MSTEERNPESGEELTSLNADSLDLDQLDDAALEEVAGGNEREADGEIAVGGGGCGTFGGPCTSFTGPCTTFG